MEDAEATSRRAADSVPDQTYTDPTRRGRSRLHEETLAADVFVAGRENRSRLGRARDHRMLESAAVVAAAMVMESVRVDAAAVWIALAIGVGHAVETAECKL